MVTSKPDGSIKIDINKTEAAYFTGGVEAGSEWAYLYLEVERLRKLIDEHASWLHSRTIEQADGMGVTHLRNLAVQLRKDAGI
jgi:hypothetical protein